MMLKLMFAAKKLGFKIAVVRGRRERGEGRRGGGGRAMSGSHRVMLDVVADRWKSACRRPRLQDRPHFCFIRTTPAS